MEEPGPRPGTTPRPLIIRHPELLSPLRRVVAFMLTLAVWVIWTLLLLPISWLAAARFGIKWPPLDYFARFDLVKLGQLLDFFPWALLLVLIGLGVALANGLVVKLLRGTQQPRIARVYMRRAMTDVPVDAARLASWQSARIVQIEHGENGRVQRVQVLWGDENDPPPHR
jgi:poly-beta-1,6-N-acetyl-D-glucosamine biosynthesis protein PgaD